jgi:hypothetical protein
LHRLVRCSPQVVIAIVRRQQLGQALQILRAQVARQWHSPERPGGLCVSAAEGNGDKKEPRCKAGFDTAERLRTYLKIA